MEERPKGWLEQLQNKLKKAYSENPDEEYEKNKNKGKKLNKL